MHCLVHCSEWCRDQDGERERVQGRRSPFFWGRDSAFVGGEGRRKEEAGEEEEEERERSSVVVVRERVDERTGVVAVADSCRLPERAAKKHPGSSDSLPD